MDVSVQRRTFLAQKKAFGLETHVISADVRVSQRRTCLAQTTQRYVFGIAVRVVSTFYHRRTAQNSHCQGLTFDLRHTWPESVLCM